MIASFVSLLTNPTPPGPALLVASFAQLYFVGASPCRRLALMIFSASQGKYYLAVGCTSGIYVGMRADSCELQHFASLNH